MGCNCGGSSSADRGLFLVNKADKTRVVVDNETAARLQVTLAMGGTWMRIDRAEADTLAAEGVTFL